MDLLSTGISSVAAQANKISLLPLIDAFCPSAECQFEDFTSLPACGTCGIFRSCFWNTICYLITTHRHTMQPQDLSAQKRKRPKQKPSRYCPVASLAFFINFPATRYPYKYLGRRLRRSPCKLAISSDTMRTCANYDDNRYRLSREQVRPNSADGSYLEGKRYNHL